MWLARSLQRPGSRSYRLLLAGLRFFSPSAAAGSGDAPALPAEPAHFMVDYLVSSCGLSRLEALKASMPLAHLKTPEKPDAVLRLLRREGLGDDHIRRAVQKHPAVLLFKPEKTLEPKIRALRAAGFTGAEVAQLISLCPTVVHLRDLPRRLEFWRKVIGTKRDVLIAMKRMPSLLSYSINNKIIPRLSLFRDLGIPDETVGKLIVVRPRLATVKPDWVKSHMERVKGLEFSPGSGMFLQAFLSLANLSRASIDAKSKLLRSFGWTEIELTSVIRRFPNILMYSEKKIQAAMRFLLNEAGCDVAYVAGHPTLVGYSLEKRLIPRNSVLQSLKKKGLPSRRKTLSAVMQMSDYDFIRKFVVPYRDQLPELPEAYHALLSTQAKASIDSLRATHRICC